MNLGGAQMGNRTWHKSMAAAGVGLIAVTAVIRSEAATVQAVEFLNATSSSEVLIRSDGPLEYELQTSPSDRQLTLVIRGSDFGPKAARRLDTSSFDAPVTLVSPFKASGESEPARLVVQLKDFVEPEVKAEGNLLRVVIPRTPGTAGPMQTSDPATPSVDSAPKTEGERNLEQFMDAQVTKRFSGSPVTLQVRETPIADVLSMIGDASGFNIILGDGVEGKVTLSLVDVPWDQALDVVLSSKRLGAERRNNVLRISTLANLTAEKEELIKAKLAAERSAPRVTRIFPVSYADIKDLQAILNAFSANNAALLSGTSIMTGVQGQITPGTASIQVDERTNSVIVQDTAENMEKIRKLIKLMDTQTPQVLIEAKVVEASEEFTKSMAGQLGFSRINSDGRGNAGGFNGAPVTTGLSGTAFSATAQGKGGLIGYSPSLAFLPTAIDRLNLFIQMQETQENAKVISSPKTVVLNKKTAKILKGTPTSIFEQISTPGGTTTTQRVVQAELSLEVKPTVTNAGSVLMALKINRDTVLNNLVAPRNINTEVLVDSGNTLVIGGIFTSDENRKSNGFPVLRDLPIIGWFFGGKSNTQNRSELFIFVTPRILESVEQQKMLSLPQEGGEAIPQDAG